jgi:hypothetical protein
MKRLIYGVLSSLLIVSTTVPAQAKTPTPAIALSNATIERMFREQKVFSEDIETLMTQMKAMMAEMKALTAAPAGQAPTMTDLYKQQQVMQAQIDTLLSRSRFDSLTPRGSTSATVEEVHQQQQAMIAEMKSMMGEMKKMVEIYRGRAGVYRP